MGEFQRRRDRAVAASRCPGSGGSSGYRRRSRGWSRGGAGRLEPERQLRMHAGFPHRMLWTGYPVWWPVDLHQYPRRRYRGRPFLLERESGRCLRWCSTSVARCVINGGGEDVTEVLGASAGDSAPGTDPRRRARAGITELPRISVGVHGQRQVAVWMRWRCRRRLLRILTRNARWVAETRRTPPLYYEYMKELENYRHFAAIRAGRTQRRGGKEEMGRQHGLDIRPRHRQARP
jgi:hypothetical protein